MSAPADPSRHAPMRRLALLGVALFAAVLSCGKDVTEPASAGPSLSWQVSFPKAFQLAGGISSGVVLFNRVHILLHHEDSTVALDTTIGFPAGADSLTLHLTVKLLQDAPLTGEPMTLDLAYVNAAGDTVFKGGPVSIIAQPLRNSAANPAVKISVAYTGVGANAAAVVISPRSDTATAGTAFQFTAAALDVNGAPIAGTPIVWTSLDPTIASITSPAAGVGIALSPTGGTARIVAQLLTGPADTVIVDVLSGLAATTRTWTGATSTDWTVASNWSPPIVPVATDSVVIPAVNNQPSVATTVAIRHLTLTGGAVLTNTGEISVGGSLDASGGSIADSGIVALTGSGNLAGTIGGTLILSGGMHVLTGNVTMNGNFATAATGTLVMNNALDSLFVVGQATFAGGAEAGMLTNGVLVLFQGIAVAGAGQFSASANHLTYLVGPGSVGCQCTQLLPPRQLSLVAAGSQRTASGLAAQRTPASLAARRAAATAAAAGVRAQAAARLSARKALAANWVSRATGVRTAAAAGAAVGAVATSVARAARSASVPTAAAITGRPTVSFNVKRAALGSAPRTASMAVVAVGSAPVAVAFADTTGNQFANVRVLGFAQWETFARVTGDVVVDTTGNIEGNGHLAIGGTLFASTRSTIGPEAVELFGVLSDSGYFSPDTTLFSGLAQTIPSGGGSSAQLSYNNVVVNSPALSALADDYGMTILGSVFIMGSGQLQIGVPVANCNGCEANLDVNGAFETHGGGALRMTETTVYPLLVVYGDALFAGGSTSQLLTQGEIDFYGNVTQTGSATAYAATTPHLSLLLDVNAGSQTISFANPGTGTGASHFGDVALGDTSTALLSNVFADGQLETSTAVSSHHVISTVPGAAITSWGADVISLLLDSITWTLNDGAPVIEMDSVDFEHQVPTAIQFTVQRNGTDSLAWLADWTFGTTPSGNGLYIRALDTTGGGDGALTLKLTGTITGLDPALTSTSGGASILILGTLAGGGGDSASATWADTGGDIRAWIGGVTARAP